MKKWALYFSLTFAVLFSCSSLSFASDMLIIVNKGVSVSSVTKDELKRIYLGKMSRWENGDKVNFCLLETNLLEDFTNNYLNYSAVNFFKYWKKRVFTGQGSMPPFFAKDEGVVNFVANTKGGIGFVPQNANTDSVKVITVE